MSFKKSQIPDEAVNTKEIDSIYTFLAHIDWTDPGIQALVTFHVITLLLIIATRSRVTFQGTLFTLFCKNIQLIITPMTLVTLVISIGLSEKTNEYMAANYKQFFRQQYFDSYGMFISLMYSAPVLVNCVIILVNWFSYSSKLLVDVKQRELKEKMKESKKSK